jgi:hypothetical protein
MGDVFSVDTQRSLDSELADASIKAGEPAVRAVGGGVSPLDVTSDTTVDALVVHERAADSNARYEFEYTSYDDLYTYEPAGNKSDEDYDDRVPLLPLTKKDHIRTYAIEDTSVTEPTYEENDEVGFIDLGNGPRLVPAGYSTGGTQYGDGGTGDFVSIGVVDNLPTHKTQKRGYDILVPVRVENNV